MKLSGNTVLVTGCGMGIGALTAERLAKEGNDIIGVDIKLPLLKEIQNKVESLGRKFYLIFPEKIRGSSPNDCQIFCPRPLPAV
ncbi:SDR family NAD(P)-dependent oxidoreductase [Leptospira chreensis]|uniref:SDR family NAD(P)-dependent oxidoreductase n=1 Tax=Leptospira chreensis TaxID=2810035 RepID=UPI001E32B844|nr:SDR family NAD(P)-dependent oxidoreductase [Leptospira chreensis]